MLNFELSGISGPKKQWRDKAREFACAHILPVAWHYDAQDETPLAILDTTDNAGLVNTKVPVPDAS